MDTILLQRCTIVSQSCDLWCHYMTFMLVVGKTYWLNSAYPHLVANWMMSADNTEKCVYIHVISGNTMGIIEKHYVTYLYKSIIWYSTVCYTNLNPSSPDKNKPCCINRDVVEFVEVVQELVVWFPCHSL